MLFVDNDWAEDHHDVWVMSETGETDWTDAVGVAGNVVSFGVDHTGEVYVLTTDAIRRIEPLR